MSKNEETTTITVVNTDEFKKLPVATQKLITKLTKDLKVNGLNLLNPLVESMVIIDGFKSIKYDAENEDTIKQYKEAKSTIRSFNASTRKAKKLIKAPLLATGKDLDKIERTFLDEAKQIQEEYLDVEFKPYLDAEEQKKIEAEEKKNAQTKAQIAELTEASIEQQLAISRSKIFSDYNSKINLLLPDVMNKVESYSKEALEQELLNFESSEFIIAEEHINTLLDDQIENIKTSYSNTKATSVRLLKSRINEMIADEEKKANAIQQEAVKQVEKIEISKPMIAPSVDGHEDFATVFKEQMMATIDFIGDIYTKNDKEAVAQKSAVTGLNSYMIKILNYLDDEKN